MKPETVGRQFQASFQPQMELRTISSSCQQLLVSCIKNFLNSDLREAIRTLTNEFGCHHYKWSLKWEFSALTLDGLWVLQEPVPLGHCSILAAHLLKTPLAGCQNVLPLLSSQASGRTENYVNCL